MPDIIFVETTDNWSSVNVSTISKENGTHDKPRASLLEREVALDDSYGLLHEGNIDRLLAIGDFEGIIEYKKQHNL